MDLAKEKRRIEETHSYACKATDGGDCESIPNTPIKNHASKKSKCDQSPTEIQPTLMEVQNTIIQILSEKINNRADQLEKMIKYNSAEIENISEALNSVHNDVLDLKKENEKLKSDNADLKKKTSELEQRVNEQERYSRRWCLRLYGMPENAAENAKEKVKDVCRALVPEKEKNEVVAALDIAHRLGRLRTGEDLQGKPRPIIIRFTSRAARDLIWKHAKQNTFLPNQGFTFKEDLTADDKAARSHLWPAVEKARKEGKIAYFSGVKAFVDGKEIRPTVLEK